MNSLLKRDDFWTDFFSDRFLSPWTRTKSTWETATFQPACDVTEEKEHFLLSMDLPGVPKEDVKIEVKDGYLTIEGERKSEKSKSEDGYKYFEKSYGSFHRSFRLGEGLDANNIEAQFENGVLNVAIGKAAQSQGKTIAIKDTKTGSLN